MAYLRIVVASYVAFVHCDAPTNLVSIPLSFIFNYASGISTSEPVTSCNFCTLWLRVYLVFIPLSFIYCVVLFLFHNFLG